MHSSLGIVLYAEGGRCVQEDDVALPKELPFMVLLKKGEVKTLLAMLHILPLHNPEPKNIRKQRKT